AEARKVLDIHGGKDVDSAIEQNLHVLPAALTFGAGRVRVGQVVDNADLGCAAENSDDVNFFRMAAAARDAQERDGFKLLGAVVDVAAALRFEKAEHDIDSARVKIASILEHAVGLADSRCVTQVNFQMTASYLWTHGLSRKLVRENANVYSTRRANQPA